MPSHQVRSYGPAVSDDERIPAPQYEIKVQGRLSPWWSAWFDGLAVEAVGDGTTTIRGPIVDQAALHGLLQKLRDVGIPLVSLTQLPTNPGESR
jgi:hypothetical protein